MAITLATSIGDVTIKEAFEGYEAGIDVSRGPWIKKQYLCPTWASAFPVANALMGGGNTPIAHTCPESHNLRCLDARLMPRAEYDARDGGRPQFNLPVVEATYGVPTWAAIETDDPDGSFPSENSQPYLFMEQSIDWDVEVIKLPTGSYGFLADGMTLADTPVAKTIAVAQFVLVLRWQTTLPYANVTQYLNRVNSTTFLGQPQGTIKFRKARTRRQFTSDGTRAQEVEYVFQWREFDHNKMHRPDRSSFELIVDLDGKTPYQYIDLNQLLNTTVAPPPTP